MMRLGAAFRDFLSCLWILGAIGGLAARNTGPPATGIPHEVVIPNHGGAKAFSLPDSTSAQGRYQGESDYRIGPHDLIEISVFQIAELSHKVRVNSKGMVSLPLIGAVEAGGRTVSQLEADIASRLGDKYVRNPQVTVFVEEFTSQRVTVEGAVNKPGIYPLTGKTTLLQTIALVGGLGPLADDHSVVIFRTINGKKMAALFDIPRIRHSLMEDPLVFGDDIVVVDRIPVSGRTNKPDRAAVRELVGKLLA